MSESALSKLKTKVKTGKALEIVVILLLAVVVAAVIFAAMRGNSDETASDEYADKLSAQLSTILSQIEGAGEVDVFITVASEGEKIIATESIVAPDGTVTTTPILSGGDVIVLEEKNPEITGVLIVAEGASDLNVRFSLFEATASVLHINQSIIKVYTKSGSA